MRIAPQLNLAEFANLPTPGALAIHGGNPQFLIEKVIRARIYDSIYWKEQCFALTGGLHGIFRVSFSR